MGGVPSNGLFPEAFPEEVASALRPSPGQRGGRRRGLRAAHDSVSRLLPRGTNSCSPGRGGGAGTGAKRPAQFLPGHVRVRVARVS